MDDLLAVFLGALGCIGTLIYIAFMISVATITIWFALYFVGVIDNLPWQ